MHTSTGQTEKSGRCAHLRTLAAVLRSIGRRALPRGKINRLRRRRVMASRTKTIWEALLDARCRYGLRAAFSDGQGNRWFELKAFMVTDLLTAVAPTPGWEGDIAQTSDPMPPYSSKNHMAMCGKISVFLANFPDLPSGPGPNSAQFFDPSYTYLSPLDERGASEEMLNGTPCVSPDIEKRCLGNLAQACQNVGGRTSFAPFRIAILRRPAETSSKCAKSRRASAALRGWDPMGTANEERLGGAKAGATPQGLKHRHGP